VKLTTHLYLVPRLRICEAIPPLPCIFSLYCAYLSTGYAFMAWYLVKHGDCTLPYLYHCTNSPQFINVSHKQQRFTGILTFFDKSVYRISKMTMLCYWVRLHCGFMKILIEISKHAFHRLLIMYFLLYNIIM
jgi:hypothetical protein